MVVRGRTPSKNTSQNFSATFSTAPLRGLNQACMLVTLPMIMTAVLTFFVALGTIAVLMRLVRQISFLPFAVYRILLGIGLLAVIYWGVPLGSVN